MIMRCAERQAAGREPTDVPATVRWGPGEPALPCGAEVLAPSDTGRPDARPLDGEEAALPWWA